MTEIRWSPIKSQQLKKGRGVSFEEIIHAPIIGIDRIKGRKNQKVLLFNYNDYAWAVPFVINKDEVFLKTLFPSRKFTKLWKKGKYEKNEADKNGKGD